MSLPIIRGNSIRHALLVTELADTHPTLVDVRLVDDVNALCSRCSRLRDRWLRPLEFRQGGDGAVEQGLHFGLLEIPGHRDHEIARTHQRVDKGLAVSGGHRVHRGLGREAVHPVVLAVDQAVPLPGLDIGGVVVALLHSLQHVVLGLGEPVLLEAGLGEDIHEDGHGRVEVLGQHVQAHRAGDVTDTGVEVCSEETELLVQFLSGPFTGATGAPGVTGDGGQTGLAVGLEIASAPEIDRDADQRELTVLFCVNRRAVSQFETQRICVWNMKREVRVDQFLGPIRDICGGDCRCGDHQCQRSGGNHQAAHVTPPLRPTP